MLAAKRKVPISVRIILGTMGLFWMIAMTRLVDHYEKICPARPDEEQGFVYPLNEHGSVVYLNLDQHRKIIATDALLVVTGISTVATVIWASRR